LSVTPQDDHGTAGVDDGNDPAYPFEGQGRQADQKGEGEMSAGMPIKRPQFATERTG
jgi:hypothetical protein